MIDYGYWIPIWVSCAVIGFIAGFLLHMGVS